MDRRTTGAGVPSTVKQKLAAVRMCFDWLATGQVLSSNPARSVRGPRLSVTTGATPVLSSDEARQLLQSIDTSTATGLRDRAIIAVMAYTFAWVGAVVGLQMKDYYVQDGRRWLKLCEKNGRVNQLPCHHLLEEYLDAWLAAARADADAPGLRSGSNPLFRSVAGRTGRPSQRPLLRGDVWRLVQKRAAEAGIKTAIGCHTFRATGITSYLANGGRIDVAQRMAGHASAKTTSLYDRRGGLVSLLCQWEEVERIGI